MNRLTTAWVSAYEGPRLSEDHWRDPVSQCGIKTPRAGCLYGRGSRGLPGDLLSTQGDARGTQSLCLMTLGVSGFVSFLREQEAAWTVSRQSFTAREDRGGRIRPDQSRRDPDPERSTP